MLASTVAHDRAEATPGYDAAFLFQSDFMIVSPGDSFQFLVTFLNTGALGWQKGGSSQVNLAQCCPINTPSPNAAWLVSPLSTTAYATHRESFVAPGQRATFIYNLKAPTDAKPGEYRFDGDLVLAATAEAIRREGYFQVATVRGRVAAPASPTPTATPTPTLRPTAAPSPTPRATPAPTAAAPLPLPRSPTYLGVGGGHWVRKKIDRGRFLQLEDRSLWEVHRLDRYQTAFWFELDDIVVANDPYGFYPYAYTLINASAGEIASARYLLGEPHWIRQTFEAGRFVLLDDGTLWEIDSFDRLTTILWLALDDVILVDDPSGIYPYTYRIINPSDRASAAARPVGPR